MKKVYKLILLFLIVICFSIYGYKSLYKENLNSSNEKPNIIDNTKKTDKEDNVLNKIEDEVKKNEEIKKEEKLEKSEKNSNLNNKNISKKPIITPKPKKPIKPKASVQPNKPSESSQPNPLIPPSPPSPPSPPVPPKPPVSNKVEIPAGQAVKTTYEKDGKKITTLWTKGIKPPKITDFKEEKYNEYLIVTTKYKANQGWYDTNKALTGESDRVLCSGAVASNMLHWWLEQNKEYVTRFLNEKPDRAYLPGESNVWKNLNTYISSFKNQNSSKIFDMYKLYYGNTNGIWSDTAVDFFINGYKLSLTGATNTPTRFIRDQRGGFFHEVFETETLTNRLFSGSYDSFSNIVKKELQKGNIIGIEHTTSFRLLHIITLWGADFDENGKIIGLFVSDSDDNGEVNVGMRRINVNKKGEKPAITSSVNKNVGSNLEYIHTLSLGKNKWEAFFK